jgi:hypothetical protein
MRRGRRRGRQRWRSRGEMASICKVAHFLLSKMVKEAQEEIKGGYGTSQGKIMRKRIKGEVETLVLELKGRERR